MSQVEGNQLSMKMSLAVYGWLVVLTLFEVAVVYFGLPKGTTAAILGLATLVKALLIGLYFMHIRYDKPIVWLLPAIPIFLGLLFVITLFPDIVYQLTLRF